MTRIEWKGKAARFQGECEVPPALEELEGGPGHGEQQRAVGRSYAGLRAVRRRMEGAGRDLAKLFPGENMPQQAEKRPVEYHVSQGDAADGPQREFPEILQPEVSAQGSRYRVKHAGPTGLFHIRQVPAHQQIHRQVIDQSENPVPAEEQLVGLGEPVGYCGEKHQDDDLSAAYPSILHNSCEDNRKTVLIDTFLIIGYYYFYPGGDLDRDYKALHTQEFQQDPDVIVSAPGVANLMGEHTEFAEGHALSFALPFRMRVLVSRRDDHSFKFYAPDLDERKKCSLTNLKYKREDRWANYLKGSIYGLQNMGCPISGMNITVGGNVPRSIGLGSSAAIVVAATKAIAELEEFELTELQMLQSAHQAETAFLQEDTGLLPHLACHRAKRDQISLIDTHTLSVDYHPFSPDTYRLLLVDTRVPSQEAEEDREERLELTGECMVQLKEKLGGRDYRHLSISEIRQSLGILPESRRRICIHVAQEYHRVSEVWDFLRVGDYVHAGKEMLRSHEGLRDLMEVSVPEIDWIVKRGTEMDGVLGSRLSGRGFGGCVVVLIQSDALEAYQDKMEEYERIFGFHPHIHPLTPGDGTIREA
jgi:galactokinase